MSSDTLDKANKKVFLSPSHGEYGTVSWNVISNRYSDKDKYELSASLRLTDCYEVITLDFFCKNEKDFYKRLEKLEVLLSELKTFKKEMKKQHKLVLKANSKLEEST